MVYTAVTFMKSIPGENRSSSETSSTSVCWNTGPESPVLCTWDVATGPPLAYDMDAAAMTEAAIIIVFFRGRRDIMFIPPVIVSSFSPPPPGTGRGSPSGLLGRGTPGCFQGVGFSASALCADNPCGEFPCYMVGRIEGAVHVHAEFPVVFTADILILEFVV